MLYVCGGLYVGNRKQLLGTFLWSPGQTVIGVDTDCYSREMYWTDVAGKSINKARLDGSGYHTVVSGQ